MAVRYKKKGAEGYDERGKLMKGFTANRAGKNGWSKDGWVPYGVRLNFWLAKPAIEIKAFIGNAKKLETLSCIDVACVKHVTNMMFGKDALKALELALDRIEGKPKPYTPTDDQDEIVQPIKIDVQVVDARRVDDKTTA